jgi:pSer/pThr/pTyr-binding forkhead associated (FHA) protein
MRSWVIGSSADCDVIVDSPLVSARHCQLTQTPDGYVLKDLGSTNGTYVNGLGITVPTQLSGGDSIALARSVAFPWPPEVTTFVRIGRLADNDIVLDDPRVSGHHARLIVVNGFQISIEDIGSSNGTFLNSPTRRVTGPTSIRDADTLYFGSLAVPAARLLAGLRGPKTAARGPSSTIVIRQPLAEPTVVSSAVDARRGYPWMPVWLLAQAPVFAVLIIAMFGRNSAAPITAATSASVGQTVASTTFALALAAVCLGGSLAVGELAVGRSPGRPADVDPAKFFAALSNRLVVLASLSAAGSGLMLTIVYLGSGLAGPWVAMCVVAVVASLVGLFLGLFVSALVPNWTTAAGVLLACLVPMIVLGGRIWPLPRMFPPVRQVAQFMPTRWAFEGMLLLETAQRSAPALADGTGTADAHDLAEDFFPANSVRMGSRADAMALATMLIELAGLAVFSWGLSRPSP